MQLPSVTCFWHTLYASMIRMFVHFPFLSVFPCILTHDHLPRFLSFPVSMMRCDHLPRTAVAVPPGRYANTFAFVALANVIRLWCFQYLKSLFRNFSCDLLYIFPVCVGLFGQNYSCLDVMKVLYSRRYFVVCTLLEKNLWGFLIRFSKFPHRLCLLTDLLFSGHS